MSAHLIMASVATTFAMAALASPARAAEPCAPSVRVRGDEGLVASVRDLLELRGVMNELTAGCPAVAAELEQLPTGVRVSVRDADGRAVERVVSDVVTATTIIESWARSDLDDPLLAAVAGPDLARRAEAPAGTARATAPPLPQALPYSVGAALHATRGGDGSAWLDPEFAVCFFLGPVCTGALLRGHFDLGASGDSAKYDTSRFGLDVLLLAELPLRVSAVSITPGIGIGAGWLRRSFVPDSDDDDEGEDDEEGLVDADVDAGGIRLEARLGVRIPLGDSFALDITLRGTLSPFAHTAAYRERGVFVAGEAEWAVGGGVGFRYGGP